jgi:hypothetical protein
MISRVWSPPSAVALRSGLDVKSTLVVRIVTEKIHVRMPSPGDCLQRKRLEDAYVQAIHALYERCVPRLAACPVAAQSTAPAQLVSFQSPHPSVRPVMPGSASLSGGALLRVTTLGRSRMR